MIRLGLMTSECERNVTVVSTVTGCDTGPTSTAAFSEQTVQNTVDFPQLQFFGLVQDVR